MLSLRLTAHEALAVTRPRPTNGFACAATLRPLCVRTMARVPALVELSTTLMHEVANAALSERRRRRR